MLEKIVVPVDGSNRAEAILSELKTLLSRAGTEVLLFHAAYVHPSCRGADYTALLHERQEEATLHVHDLVQRLRAGGMKVRGLVPLGLPEESILDTAVEEGATLIALTTHGRSGYGPWIFGSVAERILQASSVPVLLVRSFGEDGRERMAPEGTTELQLRKILVPIDGSATSLAVLPATLELARACGSELVIVHVVENEEKSIDLPSQLGSEVEENGGAESVSREVRELGCSATPLTLQGDPASCILEVAKQKRIDLIAMATHGRAGSFRWPLGSVTQKVIFGAHLPILMVRAKSLLAPKSASAMADKAGYGSVVGYGD